MLTWGGGGGGRRGKTSVQINEFLANCPNTFEHD